MAIQDIYSKRGKKQIDVFQYESLTIKLKIQIGHIWKNFFLQLDKDLKELIWKDIHRMLCEEHGKKTLLEDDFMNSYLFSYKVEFYFEELTNTDESLDIIEKVFQYINGAPVLFQNYHHSNFNGTYLPEQAIKDLNTRFLENGFGYEFQGNKIIRIDNTLLHKNVIVETLNFLASDTFKNANDEFINAHLHFRNKRQKECLVDCLRALETTLKIICNENEWQFKKSDTARELIDICIKNKLIPDFLLSHFTAIRASIESGVPTVRNKLGGHGQGANRIIVPDHYASYLLYLTGTTINFLVSCQREIKPFI